MKCERCNGTGAIFSGHHPDMCPVCRGSGKRVTPEPLMIQAVVVGGVAAGTCIKIRADAGVFELSAPEYVKPLASAHQIAPEVAKKRDVYELHPIEIVETREKRGILGIAVLKGHTLSWAYQQLVEAYAEKTTEDVIQNRVLHS